jgi:branched-chain amino acid transport system ATP-binding protein
MLKIEQIDVFYGSIQALRNFSIEVEKGQIVTLIGSNGAGKSTTLKTISGLLHPKKGSITYNGKPIQSLSTDAIFGMGIGQCPEERHLWPDMTVWENIIMGAYTRKDKKAVQDDLEMVYRMFPVLKERKNQNAGSLSGGEQQMAAIGRALMGRPDLLMFDEPSLGLSPLLVEQISDKIREINKQGTTILLVEQNAFMALGLADKAYVLETGRVVMEGTSSELLNNEHVKKAFLGR